MHVCGNCRWWKAIRGFYVTPPAGHPDEREQLAGQCNHPQAMFWDFPCWCDTCEKWQHKRGSSW